jgi:hypothetical protein
MVGHPLLVIVDCFFLTEHCNCWQHSLRRICQYQRAGWRYLLVQVHKPQAARDAFESEFFALQVAHTHQSNADSGNIACGVTRTLQRQGPQSQPEVAPNRAQPSRLRVRSCCDGGGGAATSSACHALMTSW